ncbi:unnamed protein product [Parajaminaea phylloscopi]
MNSFPRQSIFPGMASGPGSASHDYPGYGDASSSSASTQHLASLQASLSSLTQTVEVLQHTNSLLSDAVADVPRLSTALTSKRHFDVVSDGTVQEAKKQIEDEIRPLLKELIAKGEEGLAREEANARRNRNKVSQLTTRLEQLVASEKIALGGPSSAGRRPSAASSSASNQLEQQRLRLAAEEKRQLDDLARVRKRRDELERELNDLEAEVERAEIEAAARSISVS